MLTVIVLTTPARANVIPGNGAQQKLNAWIYRQLADLPNTLGDLIPDNLRDPPNSLGIDRTAVIHFTTTAAIMGGSVVVSTVACAVVTTPANPIVFLCATGGQMVGKMIVRGVLGRESEATKAAEELGAIVGSAGGWPRRV
jgi:hypothetical protein